ncbi:hypothetical protein L915_21792 [Phytophthora nicotianae]|uniref:HAT C-terminal dimerisation domain-containing protein n=1 Tax=Phytophthora nicotianae TaxID=4792 RepID=W2FJS3_PHYNI|nr:hypothetical protein L915_21792 [Phytophthora nicotianae]
MAPIIDEPDDALNADGNAAAIARLDDVLFLVGDNYEVNKQLANLMGVPLVGCASHRLNLAVREYLAPHEDALAEVQALMRKLRTLKQAAKLRTKSVVTLLQPKTALQPVLRQDTRWSSSFTMLARYFRLYEHLSPDDEDLEDLIVRMHIETRRPRRLKIRLGPVHRETKKD